MPVIEGYSFTVDLQDRGMVKTLRTIKSEAQALKNVMRADFTELRNSEGSLAAYSRRLQDTQLSISKYDEAIKRLQQTNKALELDVKNGTKNEDVANAARARNINTIERYRVRIASLHHQMEEDQRIFQRLGTGIDTLRKSTEAITTSTKSFTSVLKEQGQYYKAERANVAGLRTARESLKSQLRAEVSITKSLKVSQEELTSAYRKEKSALAESRSALAKRARELAQNKKLYGENSDAVNTTKKKMSELNETIEKQESHLYGLSEKLGKNSTTLANQAKQATKVASAYRDADKASRGLGATRLGSMFRAGSQHLQHYSSLLKESTANTRKWWSESKSSFAGIGAIFGGLTAGAAKAVVDAAKIQKRYIEVKNLLQTSGETAARSLAESNAMMRAGTHLSIKYGFAQKEIGEQYEELVKRGYSGRAALGSMNAMMKASRASGDDLADTVRVTSQAVDAFGLRVTKGAHATERMRKNTERVANAIASASDRTSSSFQSTGIALGYVSGSARTLGWDVEQTSAAIGKLSDSGVEGTRAGTGLRKVIDSLIKPTKGAKEALDSAGLSIDDFHTKSGKMKDIDKVFGLINEKTKSMSQTERGAFFKAVFGSTGQQAAQILAASAQGIKGNRSELSKLIDEIRKDESGGKHDYISRLAKKNMQSAQMQMQTLKQTALAFEYTIGNALLPTVNKVGKAIGKWALSKEGRTSLKDANKYASNLGNTISRHIPDMVAFGKGLYDGLHSSYEVAKTILTPVSKLTGWLNKASGNSHQFAHNLGAVVGVVGSITVGVKLFKTLFGGIFAIGKDTVGVIDKILGKVKGSNGAQQDLNATLKETNRILQENVDLQGQFYDKEKQSSSKADDDLLIPNKNDRSAAARAGEESASTFKDRFKRKMRGGSGLSWKEVFKGSESSAKRSGIRSGARFWGRLKSKLGELSAADKISILLDVGFSVTQLTTSLGEAVHAKKTEDKYKAYGSAIGGFLGGGIGLALGGEPGMLIGQALGDQLVSYAVPNFMKGFVRAAKKLNLDAPSKQEGKGYLPQTPKHTTSYSWNPNKNFLDNLGYNYDVNVHNRAAELGHLFDFRWWNKEASRKNNKSPFVNLLGGLIQGNPIAKGIGLYNLGWNWFNSKNGKGLRNWLNSDSIAKAIFGTPQVHGKRPSNKGLKLLKSSILPNIDVGKWWKSITKQFSHIKWPKLPKLKMPKLDVKKWWGGIKKWWHNIKWPKFPKIKMPKLNAKNWARNVVKDIKGGWKGFTGWASNLGGKSAKNLKRGWKGMQGWAKGIHGNVKRGWRGFTGWASGLGHKAATALKNKWKGMQGFSNGVASKFKSGWSGMTHWFGNIGKSMVSNFKDKFNGIKDWVSDRIQDIQNAWDGTSKHVHNFLTKGHFANGTGPIQTPTLGILNDGNDAPEIGNSEGLLHKDGVLEMLSGRNVKRLLLPGDQVIKSSDMSKLLGIRHFASGTTGSIATVSHAQFNKIIQLAQSLLKSVRSISSKISKLSKSSDDSTIHDASYSSSSSYSRSKKSGKSTKSMVPFSRLGFFGNLKSVVRDIIKSGSGEKIYLSQSTRRELGYKNAKGSATVKATKSLLNRITKFYEKRKHENAKILASQRKQRANARKREEKKQRLLKREMDLVDAKYNARRKEAVLKKEEAAAKRKARATTRRYTSRTKFSSTTRTRSSSSASPHVSVSMSGASAVSALLKKIKGTHKLKIKASLTGGKSVKDMLKSILNKVNSSKSKRTIKIHFTHDGVHETKTLLSQVLKKVNSSRSKRTIRIHVKHDGVHETKELLKEVIHEVASLKKGEKNELTVHVKHDGVHDTKKALESVASTGKKMWKDLDNYSKSGIKNMKNQFNSFSRFYKRGWSSMGSGIRTTMKHFWSRMNSDSRSGLNSVIKVLRSAIGQINGVVKSFGGKKAVSKPHYLATGTGYLGSGERKAITKPTLAVLNDGHDSPETQNKEVVWTPWNNRFDVVPGQNTKALLMPGQEVFNATESKNLGFTHFATGTGALKHLYELAKKYWNHPSQTGSAMFGAIKGLSGTINSLSQGMRSTAKDQGVDWWSQLWKMVENKVDDDDLGPASGLLKAVETLGKNKHYSQGKRMTKFFADCSSLVSRALHDFYHVKWAVPNGWALTVAGLWQHAHKISRSQAKPGDPVFWLPDEHVGVYAGHGMYYSAYGPNDGGPVGMQKVAPGATFGRFNGLNTERNKSDVPKVKANTKLQKQIRGQVGKGFWKTIQKIADKYGDAGLGAFKLGGDIAQRVKALAKALKRADPRATKHGIAAIVGNAIAESTLNPNVVNSIGAAGLWQFYLGRRTGLNSYAAKHGMSWKNPATQINYALNADNSRALFRSILEGNSSVASLAYKFSKLWEVGGNDDAHVRGALEAAKILGYANGGMATKPSIFGEAGPEMAIPLSTSKLQRSRELVAQTLAMMSDNDSSSANIRNEQIMNNTALNQLVESVNKLTELVSQLTNKTEMVSTNISVDGQLLAQRLDKYQRRLQSNHLYNGRMNRSSF